MGAAASTEDVFQASEESKRALAAQYGEVLSATVAGAEYTEPGAGEMRGNTDFLIEVKTERGEPTVVVRWDTHTVLSAHACAGGLRVCWHVKQPQSLHCNLLLFCASACYAAETLS